MADKKPQLHFVTGLPRAGSTILMQLLGQNPKHHVTPTNDLIELFAGVQKQWPNLQAFQSQGLETVKPRIPGVLKGMLYGFFSEEIRIGKTIFDKNRGWPTYYEDLKVTLGYAPKMIVCLRDVRAIVASFEKLFRNRNIDWRYPIGDAYMQAQTTIGRANLLLSDNSPVLGSSINRVRDLINRIGLDDGSVIPVAYDYLVKDPVGVLAALHDNLEMEPFDGYDTDNVEQITYEDDTYYGIDLHKIRSKIEPPKDRTPWKDLLPEDYAKALAQNYTDISDLCMV
jgi:sulfotransferase